MGQHQAQREWSRGDILLAGIFISFITPPPSKLVPYWFSVAAITLYHKCGRVKHHRFCLQSCIQKSTVSLRGVTSKCQKGNFLLESPGTSPSPCLFQLPHSFLGSWFCLTSPFTPSFHHHITFSLLKSPSPSLL